MFDSESDHEDGGFKINKSYAERYDNWRRKEEYQKLKDKFGDDVLDSSSSSEIEDDDAKEITPEFEKQFLKALASVRSQDPKIYDKEIKFFEKQEDKDDSDEKSKSKREKKEKPMYLKDYERKIIVEKGGKYSDDEEDFADEQRPSSPTYVEEQEKIKSSFHDALRDSDDEGDDGDTLLTQKKKTKEQKEEEEAEYVQWMKGERETLKSKDVAKEAKDVDSLRDYWGNPDLEDGEKFLRDYILDKAYKPHGDNNEFEDLSDEDLSEDDRLLDKQEDFERKFNFRFEEPDSEFVKSYPRNITASMRKKDTTRAQKRQEIKQRKEKEKQKLHEELKKLKNLKKMEIMEQLEKLKRVTGNTSVGFSEEDMKGEFDPGQHDEIMMRVFNEQYDEQDEDHSKPVFDDAEFEEENWDEWTGYDNGDSHHDNEESKTHCEDPGFIMDADYDPELHKIEKKKKKDKKRKGKKQKDEIVEKEDDKTNSNTLLEDLDGRRPRNKHTSEFAKALEKKRPVFDPADKTFEEYFDDYYKLDYEDLIGDLPCRFKYRTVVANDFGLSTEEVLNADDKELNRWVPLRKSFQYRTQNEELSDVSSFRERGQNMSKKQQILHSLFEPRDEEENEMQKDEETEKVELVVDKIVDETTTSDTNLDTDKKEKKKKRQREEVDNMNKMKEIAVVDDGKQNSISGDTNKKEKKKKRQREEVDNMNKMKEIAVVDDGKQNSISGEVPDILIQQRTEGIKDVAPASSVKEVLGESKTESRRARKRRLIDELRDKKRRKLAWRKEISDARLKAYGVRPKTYKYKMIQDRIKKKSRGKQI